MRTLLLSTTCAGFLFACGSTSTSTPAPATDTPDAAVSDAASSDGVDAAIQGFAGQTTAHGSMVDYFTLMPIAGLVVTGNGVTSTTDANGLWSITLPGNALLEPTVTGPKFSQLIFPETIPTAADMDYGPAVMATASTYQIEQSGLRNDSSKGLVQVVVRSMGSCADSAGGTLTVVSPPGASLEYFAGNGLPDNTLTSFQAVLAPRPVAVVFNIEPGANLVLQMDHPECEQAPFPLVSEGRTYTGKTIVNAAEPGDFNSAVVLFFK